jgi:hypothetical protein
MAHSYPADVADFLLEHWGEGPELAQEYCEAAEEGLPDLGVLRSILSICYQASLLREEERPVRFRVILRPPGSFPSPGGPPHGLHRLVFAEPRPFTPDEIRRLAPAIDFYRALIGIDIGPDGKPLIWGVVTSGPRWVQALHGGRQSFQRLPANLVVRVTSPGRIAVCKGLLTLATLIGGRIVQPSLDIFESKWLPRFFTDVRDELLELHGIARANARTPWADLAPGIVHGIALHVVRRIVGMIRNSHHGGTVIILPPGGSDSLPALDGRIFVKYPFGDEEPRRRFRTILVALLNAIAAAYGVPGDEPPRCVGWEQYASTSDGGIAQLDEALIEVAHLIAGLAAIDGAVVVNKRFEILGFGAEIGGDLPAVRSVARALDAEGETKVRESVESVGQRHRSAYRLCNFVHDAVVIVVSQDGTVRFVKWHDGEVTYWDNVATSVLDI